MTGLLTDEDILAGGVPPYGDPGESAIERALREAVPTEAIDAAPLTSEDIFGGVSPEAAAEPVDPFLRPRGRVEADIEESVLETAPKKWLDPDTGLVPQPGRMRTREEIMGLAPVEEVSIWGGDPALAGVEALQASYQEPPVTVEEVLPDLSSMDTRIRDAEGNIVDLTKVTKSVSDWVNFQKLDWFAKLNQQMIEKRKRQGRQVRVGRARQRQQAPMLNPTPLRSA